MPETEQEFPEHPVDGDGVITIVAEEKEQKMAVDLPEGVANHLLTETVGNIQADNRNGRGITTTAQGVLQGAMARNFDELGTIESRANSGVIATPVAGPANKQV